MTREWDRAYAEASGDWSEYVKKWRGDMSDTISTINVNDLIAERDAAIARAEKAEAALRPFANIKMVKYSAMSSDDAWVELKGFELIDCGAFIPAKAFRDAQAAAAIRVLAVER